MTRLDKELHSRGLAKSRTAAAELVADGKVTVNGTVCEKPSRLIGGEDVLAVSGERAPYVSRGGLKLEHALRVFGIDVAGKTCLDIGASTGGFTDCMLQHGARRVYAVDVGTSQLSPDLLGLTGEDGRARVVSVENRDARVYVPPERIDFTAVDVSFISLKLILPHIKSEAVTLIKPQFELGKKHKGVITDKKVQAEIAAEIQRFAEESGFTVKGLTDSPITGKSGNREFLMWLFNSSLQ